MIPPLFYQDKFVMQFKEKAEIFTSSFAKKISLIKKTKSNSGRIFNIWPIIVHFLYFSVEDDIAKIIENLDPNKIHGHNSISIIFWTYVLLQYINLQKWYLSNGWKLAFFPQNGERTILFIFTKKNTRWKITLNHLEILERLQFVEVFKLVSKIFLFHQICPVLNRVILH